MLLNTLLYTPAPRHRGISSTNAGSIPYGALRLLPMNSSCKQAGRWQTGFTVLRQATGIFLVSIELQRM